MNISAEEVTCAAGEKVERSSGIQKQIRSLGGNPAKLSIKN